MNKTSWKKALLSAALCVAILTAMAPVGLVEAKADTTISDLNSQYDKLQQQVNALQNKIDQAKTEKAKQQAIKNKTTQDITITKQQIAVLEEKITLLEQEIADKEEEIAGLEDDIAENYELFKTRMTAMYTSGTSGDTAMLSLVLGTESFGQFLTRSETLKKVAEHDQALLDHLKETLAAVEDAKAAVEEDKKELDATKVQLDQKKAQLNNTLTATNAAIQDISAMEKEYLANQAKYQQQMKDVQSELDKIYAAMGPSGDFVGGGFMYPVPGYRYISSYFGWRFNGTDYHTGVDFTGSGVNGKSVVASNSGTVSFTKTTYTPGVGYGKYIIVDHGGGYSTLYAHLSSVNVSVGEFVAKGKNIANVGSTGWSTGPHLHFEVRVGGVAKNPLNYLVG